MTDRGTPVEPGAAGLGPRAGDVCPTCGRPPAPGAAPPRLKLVVADQEDRHERQLELRIGPDGRCTLTFPNTAPPRTEGERLHRSGGDNVRMPAEHRRAMERVLRAARRHDLALAVHQAERLLVALAASFGPRHSFTLTAAQVRADLAWASGNFRRAAELWTSIADGWARLAGPTSRPARFSARQAAASWLKVPDGEAVAGGAALLAMLVTVAPDPESNPVVLAVRRRMGQIGGSPLRAPAPRFPQGHQ
ncbi:tetratricopeptide repeat protein [Kitasatospora sp. NPDC088346]|uniref:tetratricopeptide repeat protein n=1 Tax=Kitasatospora sp. NPDC088346 TaxID=3364073 RepID=UPI003830961D